MWRRGAEVCGVWEEEKGENMEGSLYLLQHFAKTKLPFLEPNTLLFSTTTDFDLHQLFPSLL